MRERPVSVTIFGILNIGFGLLGLGSLLLSTLFDVEGFGSTAFSPALNSYISSMLALWDAISADTVFVVWRRLTVPLDFAASLTLVAAGIGLLLLRNWSRLVSIGYAIYRIIFAFLDVAVLFVVLRRVLANALPASTGANIALVIGGGGAGGGAHAGLPGSSNFLLDSTQGCSGLPARTRLTPLNRGARQCRHSAQFAMDAGDALHLSPGREPFVKTFVAEIARLLAPGSQTLPPARRPVFFRFGHPAPSSPRKRAPWP